MIRQLRVIAPAKVNLHLHVGALRPDGYHQVATVLHALEFSDVITISADGERSFGCTPDIRIPDTENLAYKAARLMAETFGRADDVSIALEKHIPSGAGLGGASADAAAVITGLAELWEIPRSSDEVVAVARSLGADVPFFLEGGAALFVGRGDLLEAHARPLDLAVTLVKPGDSVPTAEAYRRFDELRADRPVGEISHVALMRALDAGDADRAGRLLRNNMTSAAVTIVPAIAEALEYLKRRPGLLGASMTGSGSACFGFFEHDEDAACAAADAEAQGFWSCASRTRATGCEIKASGHAGA